MQREQEETEGRLEMQLTALNENLATLRADLSSSQARQRELEKTCDEVRGEKLGEFPVGRKME